MSRILITGCSKGLGRATVIELARRHRQRSLRAELDNSFHIRDVSATKAAAWALTNWLRTAVREQGTQVLGLHVGPVDTDMARELTLPKVKPVDVVRQVLSAIEAGRDEVLADDMTRQVKAGLSDEAGIYLNFDPDRALAAAS